MNKILGLYDFSLRASSTLAVLPIMPIIEKHKVKKALSNFSTFYDSIKPDEPVQRVGMKYHPSITKQLKPVFRNHKLQLVHRNDSSLRMALGSIKDVHPVLHKSGIYSVTCRTCGRIYFGKSIRKIYIRYNEHEHSANWRNKTAVGKHIFTTRHNVNISGLKLVQQVTNHKKIEWYEAIHIQKNWHKNLLNMDKGSVNSPLLSLFRVKRRVDPGVIDLIKSSADSSIDESFYDCES